MTASILSIATACPQHRFEQGELAEWMIELIGLKDKQASRLRRLSSNSCIDYRHSAIPEIYQPLKAFPGMSVRNQLYKEHAPKLAYEAASKALLKWGGLPQELTHIIYVSCTGVMAPGVEFLLMQRLGLNPKIRRLGLNFMGCFGAFSGLEMARAFAEADPKARILLVCTELCSLHFQTSSVVEKLIGNVLFADGASAVVVGASPAGSERPLYSLVNSTSFGIGDSLGKMTWEADDSGLVMGLSIDVPRYLNAHVESFAGGLSAGHCTFKEAAWALHPGGRAILEAIEKTCRLERAQTAPSWEIMRRHGNMSSATFLFILEEQLKFKAESPWVIGMGFGPGLAMEGVLLKCHEG